MHPADLVVFCGCLAAITAVGFAASRRGATREEFLVARRSLPWFPIGASIMATVFSAVNFVGFSGEVAGHGLYVLMAVPAFLLVAWPILARVIPFYHAQQTASAYAFLEPRFGVGTRRMASLLFIGWRISWLAVVLHATARILAAPSGLPLPATILLIGGLATAYTARGGMRSVVWTDVVQGAILIGALLVALFAALRALGGLGPLLALASDAGRLRPFTPFDPAIFSPDPRIRITLWSALIGTCVAFLARYGADQMVVQRYFASRSLRDARRGFILNLGLSLFAVLVLGALGLAAFGRAAALGRASLPPVRILAEFLTSLPPGVGGLLLAGLAASTMASVDSGIHSCVTALTTDFPLDGTPAHDGRLTLGLGVLAITGANAVGHLGTVFEMANKIINGLGSPLLALLIAARFFPRTTSRGLQFGGGAGIVLSIGISGFVEGLALHHYAVANLLVTLACIAAFSHVLQRGANRKQPGRLPDPTT